MIQLREQNHALRIRNQQLHEMNQSTQTELQKLHEQQHVHEMNIEIMNSKQKLASTRKQFYQKQLHEHKQRLAQLQKQYYQSQLQVSELRDEINMKQNTYIEEVKTRLRCQKSLEDVLLYVQTNCNDTSIVEHVLSMIHID